MPHSTRGPGVILSLSDENVFTGMYTYFLEACEKRTRTEQLYQAHNMMNERSEQQVNKT
jgi:hypothetical protein